MNEASNISVIFDDTRLKKKISQSHNMSWNFHQKELGDYQTPSELVNKVINVVNKNDIKINKVIEPTMGKGNFIIELLKRNKEIENVIGIEKQEEYLFEFASELKHFNTNEINYKNIKIFNENFFNFDVDKHVSENTIFIGNPPWVTNSNQSTMKSNNVPDKSNFRLLKGMDAITGKSNFDISEAIIIKILQSLSLVNVGYIALLVKNIVARNILYYSEKLDCKIETFKMYMFNAKKEFNVNTSASLLFIKINNNLSAKNISTQGCIYDLDNPDILIDRFGWVNNHFVSSVKKYKTSNKIEKNNLSRQDIIWRSGIKHDASKIMEMEYKGKDQYYNKFTNTYFENEDLIYPYLKSSDIGKIEKNYQIRKGVLSTQFKIGQDTLYIKDKFPKIWEYLEENSERLDKRKSSIYKNKPRFSVFGIGEYSYKNYKVAISGMYKKSKFSFIEPVDNKPVLFDDTVYFLAFDNKKNALICLALLNSKIVQNFIKSISFTDNKRPYTKEILMRIDLSKVINTISIKDINNYLLNENLETITIRDISLFIEEYLDS